METHLLKALAQELTGEFYYNETMRRLYATDASAYREMPLAVCMPRTEEDIVKLIHFGQEHQVALIPRTAGTSLAGQVVGAGIVVDVSKHFTEILEVNKEGHWVRLQPGVIRDELNRHLKPYDLFFGPETSTANRAMIGGMVGNNSCGSNSVIYGSTRDHLIAVKAILSDGSKTEFTSLSKEDFQDKCEGKNVSGELEQKIYQQVNTLLGNPDNRREIRDEFPKPSIKRRNTGYAIDLLMDADVFGEGEGPFNFCKLIAGSEGTLAFITEIKIHVDDMPPANKILVCPHFNTIDESLRGNLIALKYAPYASELIDHFVLDCTKNNREQSQNRFFVQGDPSAVLIIELAHEHPDELHKMGQSMIEELKAAGLGYHFPIVEGEDIKKVWDLRKAGLGLLGNMPGDPKAVPVIEDTAVDVNDLPAYIADFNEVLHKYNMHCVHYAHAGSGELHLRPILDLKTKEGNQMFRTIAEEIATLVKKYKGSLSGEHGDGRLRGEFIPFMAGDKNYQFMKEVKAAWDPENLFNPGKIVDTPAMNSMLRYEPGMPTPAFDTTYDFSKNQGILRLAEMCNGTGACRKLESTGGTMCPSYMATRDEKDTTRARANILREYLTHSDKDNRFDHEEIKEVMDLCLSCKGCKSECPSNVDVAKLKSEFLQQYYDTNGIPLKTRIVGEFTNMTALAALVPGIYNWIAGNKATSSLMKSILGFAPQRDIPRLHAYTLKKWYKRQKNGQPEQPIKTVYLFADEFTNFNDTPVGVKAVELLQRLGYKVIIPDHLESGRTYMSKGMARNAQKVVEKNIDKLKGLITEETPLLGIEPSAILSFRDEYLDLSRGERQKAAEKIGRHAYLIDEFLASEMENGNIKPEQFTQEKKLIKLHGHCHQKALSSVVPTKKLLSLPANYEVQMIPSGCCGMAGSFGYEKDHYEVSMNVGELVLFPTVRKQPEDVLIAAPGTSCRHQIKDGTGRTAMHPVEILHQALV